MSNKTVLYITEIMARIEPTTGNSANVWNRVTTYYSDGTSDEELVLSKVIHFDCITDWC